MEEKVVFTIASNNYLAQVGALMDSIKKVDPSYKRKVVVVDIPMNDFDYEDFLGCQVFFAEDLLASKFDILRQRYSIIELNTSIKPSVCKKLFELGYDIVTYLDPDIMVFKPLALVDNLHNEFDILLTPHICSPINMDDTHPQEPHFLRYGVYNLGFLSLKQGDETTSYLDWWESRMSERCFNIPEQGLFVDQLINNFTPVFFDRVSVIKDKGYNMAHWNLHERYITEGEDGFYVNNSSELVFYHFSRYKPFQYELISRRNTKYTFKSRKDVLSIFQLYNEELRKWEYDRFSKIPFGYTSYPADQVRSASWQKKIVNWFR